MPTGGTRDDVRALVSWTSRHRKARHGAPERLSFPAVKEIEKQILGTLHEKDKRACDVFLTFWQWLQDMEIEDE